MTTEPEAASSERKRNHSPESEFSCDKKFITSISSDIHLSDFNYISGSTTPITDSEEREIKIEAARRFLHDIFAMPEYREVLENTIRDVIFEKNMIPMEIQSMTNIDTSIPSTTSKQKTSINSKITVRINNDEISLLAVNTNDLLKALDEKRKTLKKVPKELNLETITENFGIQLTNFFETNHSHFAFTIAEALMEEEAFKIAYMPMIIPQCRKVKPRSQDKKQLNETYLTCFRFMIDYFGGCLVHGESRYRLLQSIREFFNSRINHFRNYPCSFSGYYDKSEKPFNINNSF